MKTQITIKTVGIKDPKTKFIVEINGKEFTRTTKREYTHAMLINTPETYWLPAREFMSIHTARHLAERAQSQYPAGNYLLYYRASGNSHREP